jgi:hypothetical protein
MFDFSKYLETAQQILNAINLLSQITQANTAATQKLHESNQALLSQQSAATENKEA